MPEDTGTVKVAWLDQLSQKDKKLIDSVRETLIAQVREELGKSVDPATRPGFTSPTSDDRPYEIQIGRYRPEVKSELTGVVLQHRQGGFLPPMELTDHQRQAQLKTAIEGGFNVNLFPRGDIDNFSVTRWAMAVERCNNTAEGSSAFSKHAPWESMYYDACKAMQLSNKAMGDMVSGQDGGFLAPEEWSQRFIDQIYPAMALSALPLTRIPMGTRVTHVPRLNSNIVINWVAENASLTANQAQFQQVSFTARKQAFFVQISNELIRDSNPAAEAILRNNATHYMAIDRDKQCLLGNGQSGTPVGLQNQTNVTAGGGSATAPYAVAQTPTYKDFVTMIYNVENLNGSTNVPLAQATCTGIVGPVSMKQQILNMSGTSDTNRPTFDFGFNQMRGRLSGAADGAGVNRSSLLDGLWGVDTWVMTNILAGTAGSRFVFAGDWQHLWIMERQDIEILASNVAGTAFQNDQTWIRGIARLDVGVAHPEPFYIANNT